MDGTQVHDNKHNGKRGTRAGRAQCRSIQSFRPNTLPPTQLAAVFIVFHVPCSPPRAAALGLTCIGALWSPTMFLLPAHHACLYTLRTLWRDALHGIDIPVFGITPLSLRLYGAALRLPPTQFLCHQTSMRVGKLYRPTLQHYRAVAGTPSRAACRAKMPADVYAVCGADVSTAHAPAATSR